MKIVVPVSGKGIEGQIEEAGKAGADLVEINVGGVADFEPLIYNCQIQTIVSCRPDWEGGRYNGCELERVELLEKGIKAGADFVEIGYDMLPDYRRRLNLVASRQMCIVLSSTYFNYTPTAAQLTEVGGKCLGEGDIAKLVPKVDTHAECLRLMKWLKGSKSTVVAASGAKADLSRWLCPHFGSYLTYAGVREVKRMRGMTEAKATMATLHRFEKEIESLQKEKASLPIKKKV